MLYLVAQTLEAAAAVAVVATVTEEQVVLA